MKILLQTYWLRAEGRRKRSASNYPTFKSQVTAEKEENSQRRVDSHSRQEGHQKR